MQGVEVAAGTSARVIKMRGERDVTLASKHTKATCKQHVHTTQQHAVAAQGRSCTTVVTMADPISVPRRFRTDERCTCEV